MTARPPHRSGRPYATAWGSTMALSASLRRRPRARASRTTCAAGLLVFPAHDPVSAPPPRAGTRPEDIPDDEHAPGLAGRRATGPGGRGRPGRAGTARHARLAVGRDHRRVPRTQRALAGVPRRADNRAGGRAGTAPRSTTPSRPSPCTRRQATAPVRPGRGAGCPGRRRCPTASGPAPSSRARGTARGGFGGCGQAARM
jgi:hypothetical protein